MTKKIDAAYYENNDLSGMMLRANDRKRVTRKKTRRITMNITAEAFDDAHDLDRFMGMGYQNVLKTAIALGLRDLREIVEKGKKGAVK
jgi:hypothetical protein